MLKQVYASFERGNDVTSTPFRIDKKGCFFFVAAVVITLLGYRFHTYDDGTFLAFSGPNSSSRTMHSNLKPTYPRSFLSMSPKTALRSRPSRRRETIRVASGEFRRPGVDPLYDLFFQGLRGERGLMEVFDQLMEMDGNISDLAESRRRQRAALKSAIERVADEQRQQEHSLQDAVNRIRQDSVETQQIDSGVEIPKNDVLKRKERTLDEARAHIPTKEIPIQPTHAKVEDKYKPPQLHRIEDPDGFTYTMEVPGIQKGNLNVALQGNMIIIEGKMMAPVNDGYHSSTFKRSFALPPEVQLDSLQAIEMEGEKLEVRVTKTK